MTADSGSVVIIGASMAGLLAARALSSHFERVTIIERDDLRESPASRKGVPQAAHAHGLLASGYRVMDAYFPGMFDDLEDQGAVRGDVANDFLWYQGGRWKLRTKVGLGGIVVSRPALEAAVRQRVLSIPNVTAVAASIERPTYDPVQRRVTGTSFRPVGTDAEETMDADLVVDATGRGSQASKWLADWGYEAPSETVVKVDVGYATRIIERRPGDFYSATGGVIASSAPSTRFAAVLGAEGSRWIITLAGMLGDYPPTDEDGWLAFARSLPTNDVAGLAERRPSLEPIASYRFPANRRRKYEALKSFPRGFLAIGDAVCSFNPIYGQGMSVAAVEAEILERCIAGANPDFATDYFRRVSKVVDIAWQITTGEDFRYAQVQGKRPPGYKILSKYLDRVHAVASDDPVVGRAFFDVLNLLEPPPTMMKPVIARRVLLRRLPKGSGSPLPRESVRT